MHKYTLSTVNCILLYTIVCISIHYPQYNCMLLQCYCMLRFAFGLPYGIHAYMNQDVSTFYIHVSWYKHVAIFPCCDISMLRYIHVAIYPCCNISTFTIYPCLNISTFSIYPCLNISMLRYIHVFDISVSQYVHIAIYPRFPYSISILRYIHVAIYPRLRYLLVAINPCCNISTLAIYPRCNISVFDISVSRYFHDSSIPIQYVFFIIHLLYSNVDMHWIYFDIL